MQSVKIGVVLDPHFYFFTNLGKHAFEQNKWRPQKIQQLRCHEQDLEGDLISRRFDRRRDAVMPDEHPSV